MSNVPQCVHKITPKVVREDANGRPYGCTFDRERGPRVSVIMTLYNYADYLDNAVTSVIGQSFEDWELIIIDDASTDGGGEKADEWAASDDRIRVYHHKQNKTLVPTRNEGFWRARGDYVAILDADDMYLPDKLLQQVEYMDEHPAVGLIYADAVTFDGRLWQNYQHTSYNYAHLANQNIIPCQSVMFRRSLLETVGGSREEYKTAEDWEMWTRMAAVTTVNYLPGANYVIRLHDKQKTVSDKREHAKLYTDEAAKIHKRALGMFRSLKMERPIRVLLVAFDMHRHGVSIVLRNLVRALDPNMFEFEICCFTCGSVSDELEKLPNVRVLYAGVGKTANRRLMAKRANEWADVVHIHFSRDDFSMPKRMDHPERIIATNHTSGARYVGPGRSVNIGLQTMNCEPLDEFNPAAVTILNPQDFDELDDMRIQQGQARRIYDIEQDAHVYATVARASLGKGYDMFCSVAEKIAAEQSGATFLFIGPNPTDGEYEELYARAEQMQLDGVDIRIIDNCERKQLIELLCASDVMLLCSMTEAMPMCLLEALHLGLQVVATDVGGVKQLLGGHGATVNVKDAESMAQEAMKLCGVGVIAPDIRRWHDIDTIAARYAELYRWTICAANEQD